MRCAKVLGEQGIAWQGFELHSDVGGLWDIEGPRSTMYDSAHLISSRTKTEFADFPMPEGTALTVGFELNGQPWTALNGGPAFTFNPAVSFTVTCQTQAEVDHCWNALAADPSQGQCGWLTDRFGLSWQFVPQLMLDALPGPDMPAKQRLMAAMRGMKKPDIAALERAFSTP